MVGIRVFLITFLLNIAVIYRGIKGGIEKMCSWAMPALFACGIILFIRVITLGAPDLTKPDWNILNGFGFLWNPDFSRLKEAKVWLEAAGQIFFTLSVGIGMILTYASYLSKGDDVVLSGLTAASMNEVAEVILGGSIIVPAAFVFFGPLQMKGIVDSGTFNLSFVTMPLVLNHIPWAALFSFVWFFCFFWPASPLLCPWLSLLWHFCRTNSISAVKSSRNIYRCCIYFMPAGCIFLGNGVVDELDFWGGTFLIVLFATIEVLLFAWVFWHG